LLDRVLGGEHERTAPGGDGSGPAAVTWCSCIACSSAACVLGGVRFTSSASTIFANTGPRTNRKARFPVVWSSSMISVPVMSVA